MKLLQTAAISALLLAGCAPYQHGHFAKDASFVSKGGEAPGTPVLINTKIDPYYQAAVSGGHHVPSVQHVSHGPVNTCGVSAGCAVPASYSEPVFAAPAPIHAAPIHSAPIHSAPIHSAPIYSAPVHSAPVHGPTLHVEQPYQHPPVHHITEAAPIHVPAPIHPPVQIQPASISEPIGLQYAAAPHIQQPIVAATTVSAPPEVIRAPTVYAPPEVINMPPVYLRAQGIQAQPFPDPPYPGQQAFAGGFPQVPNFGIPQGGAPYGPPPPPFGAQPANARTGGCVTTCGGTTY